MKASHLFYSFAFSLLLMPLIVLNTWAASCDPATFSSITPPGDATDVVIDSAISIATKPSMPAYCEVKGRIDTKSTSVIQFEIRLPKSWNGKFLMSGIGGYAGSIKFTDNNAPLALSRGYAVSTTNTGHVGSGIPTWALNNKRGQNNFAYRSIHLVAILSKSIISTYYAKTPRFSYFSGCSNGGRQALMEVERYPTDFDGVIAVAPAQLPHAVLGWIWNQQTMYPDAAKPQASIIEPNKLNILTKAVLKKCDAKDGVIDGILTDPTQCNIDPAVDLPRCINKVNNQNCFTSTQIQALEKIYQGVNVNGKLYYPGIMPGAENEPNSWPQWILGSPNQAPGTGAHSSSPNLSAFSAETFLEYFTFSNPTFDFHHFNFHNPQHIAAQLATGKIFDALNPDISAFKSRGGKLILIHGWNDPVISPLATIHYYNEVVKKMGGIKQTKNYIRLFMSPGMLHCGDGPGVTPFDNLTPLENWVEKGIAPDSIIATNIAKNMTRPLCPYPQKAVLNAGQDPTKKSVTDKAENFHCK